MGSISVIGHSPNINEKDVDINKTIEIYLDKVVDPTTLSYNNIIVTDYVYNPVKGIISSRLPHPTEDDNIKSIITFTPEYNFDPNTTYYVTVPNYPDCPQSVDGEYIESMYRYTFYTGINQSGNTTNTDPLILLQQALQSAQKNARGMAKIFYRNRKKISRKPRKGQRYYHAGDRCLCRIVHHQNEPWYRT